MDEWCLQRTQNDEQRRRPQFGHGVPAELYRRTRTYGRGGDLGRRLRWSYSWGGGTHSIHVCAATEQTDETVCGRRAYGVQSTTLSARPVVCRAGDGGLRAVEGSPAAVRPPWGVTGVIESDRSPVATDPTGAATQRAGGTEPAHRGGAVCGSSPEHLGLRGSSAGGAVDGQLVLASMGDGPGATELQSERDGHGHPATGHADGPDVNVDPNGSASGVSRARGHSVRGAAPGERRGVVPVIHLPSADGHRGHQPGGHRCQLDPGSVRPATGEHAVPAVAATDAGGAERVRHGGPAGPAGLSTGGAAAQWSTDAAVGGREHPLPGAADAVLGALRTVRHAPVSGGRTTGVRCLARVQAHADGRVQGLSTGARAPGGSGRRDHTGAGCAQSQTCVVHGETVRGIASGTGTGVGTPGGTTGTVPLVGSAGA